MLKHNFLIALIGMNLLFTACTSAGNPATATPEPIPTVKADTAIIAEGRLEPVRYAEIAFSASGVISEVLVNEGQMVKKGDPLIRLGNESDTNYADAQHELANAQKALNDLQNTAGTDLAQTVIDLKDAGEEYQDAVDYLKYLENEDKVPQTETRRILRQTWRGYFYQTKTKHFKGPAPQDWIIEAENDVALKKARVDELQRAYARQKDGVDADQLAVAEARLAAAKAGVTAFSVIAPFDGVVADLPAKLGNSIDAGQPAVTLADFSHWVVNTTDLTEIDVVELVENDPVIVTLDAIPNVKLQGNVVSIGQTYTENQGDIVYEVTILLDEAHPAMRWGMTAAVSFERQD